ncbi:MAG: 16S rRNA (cytidine(1402)-2'-O)-methyltransferase [Clostridiales bacterium]|nr:16S rRNA (cytidine(1402)-2'-O)-methyltransferase [Clostridiales bacterium]
MSRLYVVGTPIGNLGDMSQRAVKVLQEADLILAEDTRVTRKLLTAFDIKSPLESYHQHNEREKAAQVIARMQAQRMAVALVSDAGMPAVSDPGALLVDAAHKACIPVLCVPGPSALAAALSASGFMEAAFAFYGFLPRKEKELSDSLRALGSGPPLAVLYEAPHRVLDLLKAIAKVYPGLELSISRELTKLHEQTLRGSAEEMLAHFAENENIPRGEFALVLKLPPPKETQAAAPLGLEAQLVDLIAQGLSLRDAQAQLITEGQRKNTVYTAALNLKKLAETQL